MMVGSLTTAGIAATELGPTLEQMCWSQIGERYVELRSEAQSLIAEMGLDGVELPATHDEYLAAYGAITSAITGYLSETRGKLNGDVVGLPLFLLTSFAVRATIGIAFEDPDRELVELIEDCLEDLGLDRSLAEVLEREAGWVAIDAAGEEPAIRHPDVLRAADSFILRVLEEFARQERNLEGINESLVGLRAEVEEFRAEFRVASARIAELVAEGNTEVTAALADVRVALVEEGVDPAEAEMLTEADPRRFWERLTRWFGGARSRCKNRPRCSAQQAEPRAAYG